MKWFKHDCDASTDSKIKKVIKKFGMDGYGFYFLLLELIGRKLEKDLDLIGFLPDDWDTEALEMESGLSPDIIGTMSDYFCEIGLFEKKDGKLFNKKIIDRCDEYTQKMLKLEEYRLKLPIVSRQTPDSVPIVSRSDKIRLDDIKLNEDNLFLEQKAQATKSPSKKSCNNPKGHPDCIESIDNIQAAFKKQFPNYGKQIMAYHQILKAGFSVPQVEDCMNAMDADKFWSSNGWDLMDVANQLGKGGGKFVKL